MGSSDERNSKAIDASVGGLVWVRRRNGSWWPGRIMGLDEVPESSLVSPKAGTPIKLLGRDDASVDWYNLEKSKRVKAFRCGEYDACIEKAKAAAANSSKKAVKYARREDAIIHALEIENAHLAKNHPELDIGKENSCVEKTISSGEVPRRFLSSKDNGNTADVGDVQDEFDLAPELMQSGISSQENNHAGPPKVQPVSEKRRRTPNDSEDDGTEGIKRMRGLEDLGMGIGSKAKGQASGLLEHIKQENGLLCDVNLGNSMPNGTLVNGNRVCSSSLKRKRSQVLNANEYSKRKNRRRPLTKVLESTAMVSVPVTCDQLASSDCSPLAAFSDSKVSGLESNESLRSLSAVINNNSDSTGVSCGNAVSLNASENVCEASHNKAKDSETSSLSVLVENDYSDRLFDVPLIGEEKHSAGFSSVFTSCSPGRTLVSGLTKQSGQSSHAEVVKTEGINGSGCTSPAAAHINGNSNGIEKSTSKWQLKGKRNSRQISRKQEARKSVDADEANNCLPQCSVTAQKAQPRFSVNTRYGTRDLMGRNSTLYEVKIEVKANYKPRNVPLVSLMSKLNGKAIVGHPLTVEVLEDGSCDQMASSFADHNAFDVPMVNAYELVQAVKPKSSSKKKPTTKRKSHIPPRKSSKAKKSSSLSKKTRRLSALTSQKPSERGKKQTMEKPKEPVVACIPLKLVFSRINEAVKGSARQTHRALPSAANT